MNGIGKLGQLYGLTPATMAGLAEISGAQAPGIFSGAVGGAPGVPVQGAGAPAAPGIANPDAQPMAAVPTAPTQAVAPAAPPPPVVRPDDTVQGPAEDHFPTVRSLDSTTDPGAASLPGVPARVVPAHWQQGSHAVALQRGMDPEELEPGQYHRDVSAGLAIGAADKRLEAIRMRAEGDATYAAAKELATRQHNDKVQQLYRDRDAYTAREFKKLEDMQASAQKEVDPDLFKGREGARFVAALMMGLNQFAVMWSGRGTNTAMQIINEASDNHIKAQQANIANGRQAYDQKANLVARNLAQFGDMERSVLAAKMQALDVAAAEADKMRIRAGTPEAEAGYLDLLAKINDTKAAHADQFAKLTHTQANETMNEHFVPAAVVGGGAGEKGKDALYVPTLGGYARDEKAAAELNKKGALRMQITENMHQIHGLMEESKNLTSTNPKDHLRLKQIDDQIGSLVNDALTKNTVLEGQGAMSAADKEVAAAAKGLQGVSVQFKPNAFISKRQENIVKAADNVLTQHRLDGEAFGIQKGKEQYAPGPTGPVSVRRLEGRNASPSKNTQGYSDEVRPPKGVAQKR